MNMIHSCNNSCVWCTQSFADFDSPNHIGRIRNNYMQNAFLQSKNLNN